MGDSQTQLAAQLFQHHGQNVIADQHGSGMIRRGEKRSQRAFIRIVQRVDFHAVLFTQRDPVLEQRHLAAAFALRRENHGIADPEI